MTNNLLYSNLGFLPSSALHNLVLIANSIASILLRLEWTPDIRDEDPVLAKNRIRGSAL